MITLKNNSKYAGLFQKAWDELYYRNQFDADLDEGDDANELKYYKNQGNTFNTLEDYFTKIKDLITVKIDTQYPARIKSCDENDKIKLIDNPKAGQQIKVNYEFIMLPLDEPRFSIDANTRDITIPANFRKLVGVEGDHVAETLIFDIDRYFDFVDLYYDQMKIWVQWDDEENVTHANEIVMKYYDPIAKKIVFGWSLDQEITKKARTISFSIRIFMKEGNDVVYNFNTKPHTITIVRALHPNLMDVQVDINGSQSFLNAIRNSTSADAHASTPTFEAPGLNLSTEIHDLEQIGSGDENYYYLDVQAITADQGVLEYGSWKYKADGTVAVDSEDGEIVYKAVEYNSAKQNKTVYYIVNAENPLSYIKAENPDTTDETLYERYWRYKIAKDAPAAGSYWTSVRHRNGNALSEEIFTNTLTLAGPGEVSFGDGPLDKDCFINKPLEFKINKTKKTKIKTLEWEYSADNTAFAADSSLGSIDPDDEAIWLTATQPGWYKAAITGVRNNTSTDRIEMTKIYRIVDEPQAVTNIRVTGDYDSNRSEVAWQNGTATITVVHDSFEKPELQSDKITYQWYILPANNIGSNIKIDAENAEEYGIDTTTVTSSSLKFKRNVDTAFKFFCTITNTLNGKSAPANTADILAY